MIDLKNNTDFPMPIITPRLIIRPVQPGDGAVLHEAKMESWGNLYQWMPWAKQKSTPQEDEETACKAYERYLKKEDFMMVGFTRDTDRFVIGTGLHRFDWAIRRFEIGYWVRSSEHGKGYAPEAANALTRYAFDVLDARAVEIEHADGNNNSRRVIEKLGYEKEGIIRYDNLMPDGRVTHRHVYSRINTDGLPELDVSWG